MHSRFSRLIIVLLFPVAFARSEDEAPRTSIKEILKARIAEDAKKAEAKKPGPAANPAKTDAIIPAEPAKPETAKPEPVANKSNATTAKETPTVLPKVEVRKERITVLDQKIAQQEQDIARERKNLKVSEVDTALNDAKIAKPLAIFGGESAQFRQRVTSERVQLMEAEKDILEAMKRARTKEEKAELQKQLDELKATRRELEKSLR